MTNTDFVTIPRAEFDRLVALAEDAGDRAALAAFEAAERTGRAPMLDEQQLDRLVAGESPVRVWREALGLSAAELARRSGVNRVYLGEIEAGRKPGSVMAMKSLSDAMGLTVDDLI